MKIRSISAIPVRLPRDIAGARGTAGSPTSLEGSGDYRWSSAYPVLYSVHFETALVRVELENGLVGWGEAQAPLAPEVPCAIVERLLRPALAGVDFDGSTEAIATLWDRMYASMRVRGHSGGFMLDAMGGVDIALWDLAGKLVGKPVCELLSEAPQKRIPAYLSGVTGNTPGERALFARRHADDGIRLVKLYYESEWEELLRTADQLPEALEFCVDALWHLPPSEAFAMVRELDEREATWLECPFYPEEFEAHAALARSVRTPIALGESYRTLREVRPFLDFVRVLQPDLGRSGISGCRQMASAFAGEVVPHVSIAMGPQIAAALHFAAATSNCGLCEFNPKVLETANAFLSSPIEMRAGEYHVPSGPGLGIEWKAEPCVELGYQQRD